MTYTRDANLAATIPDTAPRCRGGGRHARRHRGRRTGSVYAMVLGVTMLITVIGVGALATARVTGRATSASVDWQEAGALAFSAVEHAVAKINADGALAPLAWRDAYQNAGTDFSTPMGRGTMSWTLVDEGDGLIADDYADPIKVYGVGQVGKVRRVYSAHLAPAGTGLDVLRTSFHAAEGIRLSGTTIVVDGPASTNGNLRVVGSAVLRGNGGSEAAGTGGSVVAPQKPMPSPGVFDIYAKKATVIISSAAAGGTLQPAMLSADSNPYGTETNPEGVYYLRLPDTITTLQILPSSRIKGTLVIEAAVGMSQGVDLVGPISWEPHRGDLPALITRGIRNLGLSGRIAPYQDPAGVIPQAPGGLFHAIGMTDLDPEDGTYLKGCVVVEGVAWTEGTFAVTANPKLFANPPLGYSRGDRVELLPGTWKWDKPPTN